MKFMTTNFVKCSIKTCDSTTDSFPLKYQNCSLVQEEQEFNPEFIVSILDRLEWDATLKVAQDASIQMIYDVMFIYTNLSLVLAWKYFITTS